MSLIQETGQPIVLQTYRFVFAEEMTEQLSIFAQIHQYDDRKVFKDAWQNWIEEDEIKPIIATEIKRIHDNGFVGDVLDKMFKSARYYYRKKSNVIKPQQERKVYEGVPQTILMKMDEYINAQIKEHIKGCSGRGVFPPAEDEVTDTEKGMIVTSMKYSNPVIVSKISPATSFDNYCKDNQDVILQYIKEQNANGEIISRKLTTEVIYKLKKTYKNRFYNIRVGYNSKTKL